MTLGAPLSCCLSCSLVFFPDSSWNSKTRSLLSTQQVKKSLWHHQKRRDDIDTYKTISLIEYIGSATPKFSYCLSKNFLRKKLDEKYQKFSPWQRSMLSLKSTIIITPLAIMLLKMGKLPLELVNSTVMKGKPHYIKKLLTSRTFANTLTVRSTKS